MSDADFLKAFNGSLTDLNRQLFQPGLEEEFANIYIIGLPRSGTTLLTQVLFNALDIACSNNFVSKFWEAPLVGFKMSSLLLGDHKTNVFSSNYGKNEDLYSPHEFSYFWHRLLRMSDASLEAMDYQAMKQAIHWPSVRETLININAITGKPVVYKPLELIAHSLEEFRTTLPKSLFVYIERDPLEVAISLAKGRLDYYGDIHHWFSSYPPRHRELMSLPWEEQIAQQVKGLTDMYEEVLPHVPTGNLVRIGYAQLCETPWEVIDQVAAALNKLNSPVKVLHPVTEPFRPSVPRLGDAHMVGRITEAINKNR